MPGELEWAIIVGNSILWGISGAVFVLAIRKARYGKNAKRNGNRYPSQH